MEQSPYINLLVYLAGPAILALVGAVFIIWRELIALRLHVAENYVKQRTLDNVQKDVKDMKSVLYQIASKVGVTINQPL